MHESSYVAMCCSELQCVAVCCSESHMDEARCICVAVCVATGVAVRCNVCCSVLQCITLTPLCPQMNESCHIVVISCQFQVSFFPPVSVRMCAWRGG